MNYLPNNMINEYFENCNFEGNIFDGPYQIVI